MDEGLEVYLNDPLMCTGDLGGGLIWMRDHSREWFRLKPLRKMIARTISKASIIQSNQQSTDWDLPTERPRTSDSSKSSRIATKRATHLKAVGLRQTLPRNDWPNARTSTNTARGLRSGSGSLFILLKKLKLLLFGIWNSGNSIFISYINISL